MDRLENLDNIIAYLMAEANVCHQIPSGLREKQLLMRALMNEWKPAPVSADFLESQDRELQWQKEDKGIVEIKQKGVVLWQGDITRLKMDAIVNAANAKMLGCLVPLHFCIDNAIHSAAGVQLRQECFEQMILQGHDEETGRARLTKGYNLPARYVIHTVGPVVVGEAPTPEQERQLADCYRACLAKADEAGCRSIAFCCISTGVFRFPNQRAAEIAVHTVRTFNAVNLETIVFNVYKDIDREIYRKLI